MSKTDNNSIDHRPIDSHLFTQLLAFHHPMKILGPLIRKQTPKILTSSIAQQTLEHL